jgi:hypothetical protein
MKGIKNKFCTYMHINPVKNEVFYIGIGTINRPYQIIRRSLFWNNTAKKYGFKVQILHEGQTWEQASEKEREYIKKYGRQDKGTGTLVNMTDGGDGTRGYAGFWKGKKRGAPTEETRQKNILNSSKHFTGKTHTEETKQKIREKRKLQIHPMLGKKFTEERKKQMSETAKKIWQDKIHPRPMLGKKFTEEQKQKHSNALKKWHSENPMSEETKQKIGLGNKGKIITAEMREKISKTLTGKKYKNG